jgi:hypothetical protein
MRKLLILLACGSLAGVACSARAAGGGDAGPAAPITWHGAGWYVTYGDVDANGTPLFVSGPFATSDDCNKSPLPVLDKAVRPSDLLCVYQDFAPQPHAQDCTAANGTPC